MNFRVSYYLLYFILFLFFAISCRKKEADTQLPWRYDVPVLYSAEAYDYTLRQIDFQLKLAVLRGNNKTEEAIEEYINISDTSFQFEDYIFNGGWVRFMKKNISYENSTPDATYFTSIMLDQSAVPESFDINDKMNQRYQAINGFLNRLTGAGQVLISGFARDGKLSGNLEFCNPNPVQSWDKSTARNLLDLTHKTGGTSCLFDALDEMLDHMENIQAQNKSIVVLVMNKDDSLSTATLESVIQKAKNLNIKVNLIWLIDNWTYVDFTTFTELPARTGGFLIYMGDIYQVSTIFYGLDKILTNNVNYYKLDVKLTIDSPNYFLDTYRTGIKILYPNSSYYTWSFIPFKLFKNARN